MYLYRMLRQSSLAMAYIQKRNSSSAGEYMIPIISPAHPNAPMNALIPIYSHSHALSLIFLLFAHPLNLSWHQDQHSTAPHQPRSSIPPTCLPSSRPNTSAFSDPDPVFCVRRAGFSPMNRSAPQSSGLCCVWRCVFSLAWGGGKRPSL